MCQYRAEPRRPKDVGHDLLGCRNGFVLAKGGHLLFFDVHSIYQASLFYREDLRQSQAFRKDTEQETLHERTQLPALGVEVNGRSQDQDIGLSRPVQDLRKLIPDNASSIALAIDFLLQAKQLIHPL